MGNVISDSSTMTWKDRGGGVFGSAPGEELPTGFAGHLRFSTTRFIATAAGSVDLTVERYGGNTGSISATITQSDCNRSTGKYTSVSIPVSFSAGEYGAKTFSFNISTAPTDGPYWINLQLNTGPYLVRHWWDANSEIEVNDGVSVPVTDTTNVYEVNPAGGGDWTNLVDAFRAVTAPALVWVRGGSYNNEDYLSDGQGINPNFSGSRADRIIIAGYPGESATLNSDTTYIDPLTQQSPNNKGINFRTARTQAGETGIEGWTIKGLTIVSAGVNYDAATNGIKHMIVEDCEIHTCGSAAGGNIGGVFHHTVRYAAVRNCNIHDIYEDTSLHIGTHDNNACVHGYKQSDIVIEDNKLRNAAHAIYHKNPFKNDTGQSGHIVRRNLIEDCASAVRFEDHYVGRGTTYSHQDIDVYHNISTIASLIDANVSRTFYSSSGLHVYGNITKKGLGVIEGFLDTEIYNNVSILASGAHCLMRRKDDWILPEDNVLYDPADDTTWPTTDADTTKVNQSGVLNYFDYNNYDAYFQFDMAVYSVLDAQIITNLPDWRTATDPVIMPTALAGQNSKILDPVLDVNHRPTVATGIGRFGEVIGVPDSVVVGGNL